MPRQLVDDWEQRTTTKEKQKKIGKRNISASNIDIWPPYRNPFRQLFLSPGKTNAKSGHKIVLRAPSDNGVATILFNIKQPFRSMQYKFGISVSFSFFHFTFTQTIECAINWPSVSIAIVALPREVALAPRGDLLVCAFT